MPFFSFTRPVLILDDTLMPFTVPDGFIAEGVAPIRGRALLYALLRCRRADEKSAYRAISGLAQYTRSEKESHTTAVCFADPVHCSVGLDGLRIASRVPIAIDDLHSFCMRLNAFFADVGWQSTVDATGTVRLFGVVCDDNVLPPDSVCGDMLDGHIRSTGARRTANELQLFIRNDPLYKKYETAASGAWNALWCWGSGASSRVAVRYRAVYTHDPLVRAVCAVSRTTVIEDMTKPIRRPALFHCAADDTSSIATIIARFPYIALYSQNSGTYYRAKRSG